MNSQTTSKKVLCILSLVGLFGSCATISKFDQYSYAQSTSIKVDALNVMGEAVDSFHVHQTDVTQIRTSLQKMYEYEKSKPKNTVTAQLWNVLIDSTGNSFGGFLTRWQKEGRLDTTFIRESQLVIGQSFDQISGLESGKIKGATAAQ